MENRINVVLSQENKDQVLQGISSLRSQMPFLTHLPANEGDAMQMLSDGRKPFVEKAYDFASRNESISPGPEMVVAGVNDVNLFTFLSSVENELLQLVEMVRDTKQLAGVETYVVARFIYSKAKMELKMGTPGMQAIVDELGKLYKFSPNDLTEPVK